MLEWVPLWAYLTFYVYLLLVKTFGSDLYTTFIQKWRLGNVRCNNYAVSSAYQTGLALFLVHNCLLQCRVLILWCINLQTDALVAKVGYATYILQPEELNKRFKKVKKQ